MISTQTIEEIKYRSDIEQIISTHVALRRAGNNLVGLCPFHSERSPSFTVFPQGRNFYCFGCGTGGDVITFVMKMENLDYPAALETLARRAGITIDVQQDAHSGPSRSRIYEINRMAAKYFHKNLVSEQGSEALGYLKRRGLSAPMIKHFGLGYTGKSTFELTKHLREQGFTTDELIAACLTRQPDKQKPPYDYFRNRIIVPVIDVAGNIVAFGGRVMDNSNPKYLNSSDTPAFKKSRTLFSLNFAKSSCAEQIILCEGYMDVIALYNAGFKNAVATLGTAITPEQVRLMHKYSKNVAIAYDNDEAGVRAAEKAFSLFAEVGLDARILKLEGAKDPDDYVKANGAAAFSRLLEAGKTQFEFLLDKITAKYDLTSLDERVKASGELADTIAKFPSAVQREIYIHKAAELLGISHESLKNDVTKRIRARSKKEESEQQNNLLMELRGTRDRVNRDYLKNPQAAAAEEAILGILLLYPEQLVEAESTYNLVADDFVTEFSRKIFDLLTEHTIDGKFEEGLLSLHFTPDEVGRIIKMKLRRTQLTDNRPTVLTECIQRLRLSTTAESSTTDDLSELIKRRKN